MRISHVVAAATNNAIGKKGQLLWNLPNDLKFFKNTTWGMPVIMGRKTFEALNKPLAGRINIVITRQADWKAEGIITVKGFDEAFKEAEATNCMEWFIIGGGEIYKQSMDLIQRIYMTRVDVSPDGDTFYPEIDNSVWEMISSQHFEADDKHAYSYSFEIWEKA